MVSYIPPLHNAAPIGITPAPKPFAKQTMSGAISSCSHANKVPVRPIPHMTSSRISNTP